MEKRRWSDAKKESMITPKLMQQLEDMIWQKVYCCREWIVSPLYPVGSCGYCGKRPKPRPQENDNA